MYHLEPYFHQISALCQKHQVKSLYAFGSVLGADFTSESDIDLVVDFAEVKLLDYADNYFGLKFALEKILNRSIDLLEVQSIKNPFFKQQFDRQKKLVYGH